MCLLKDYQKMKKKIYALLKISVQKTSVSSLGKWTMTTKTRYIIGIRSLVLSASQVGKLVLLHLPSSLGGVACIGFQSTQIDLGEETFSF